MTLTQFPIEAPRGAGFTTIIIVAAPTAEAAIKRAERAGYAGAAVFVGELSTVQASVLKRCC